MKEAAKTFADHAKILHEEKLTLLIMDNLSTCLDLEVKQALSKTIIFILCVPPNCTEAMQPIDAGHGRSLRVHTGELIDEWLIEESSMLRWD